MMVREEFNEDGIVVESADGTAEVALMKSDNCEECSAKLFCSPKADHTKILRVSDPYGVHPGDEVKISVGGNAVLKYSFIIYGLPLFLLIAGILGGFQFFQNSASPELFSFLFGLTLTGIYFLIVFFALKKNINTNFLPRITFVKKK